MSEFYHDTQSPLIEHVNSECCCAGKRCSHCQQLRCVGQFHRFVRSRDGLRAECKICRRNTGMTEEFRAHRRVLHKENATHINEQKRAWYRENPENGPGYARGYRLRNPEKNQASIRAYNREHGKERDARRKLREQIAGGHYTTRQWRNLKAQYDYTCLCCRKREPDIKLVPDHIIPVVQLGTSDISNIQPLCMTCNQSKGVKTIDYRSRENNPGVA